MSDELDPGLRRLFAETAEHPADEGFVSAVAVRTSRRRRMMLGVRALALALLVAAAVGGLAAGFGLVLDQSAGMITALGSAPTLGWAAGLALVLAGAVCVRVASRLVSGWRG